MNELQKRILSSIILIPLVLFLLIKGSYFFNIFLLICLFFTIYEWYLISQKKFYCLPGLIYIAISFYFAYLLRNNFDGKYTLFLLILIICVSTDIGGYIFGKIFKGPKLTKISPKKTYSGVIGSFLISLLFGLIYIKYLGQKSRILLETDPIFIIFLTLFISLVSQMGDLIISYFKRKAKLKDTGNLLPGHGGLLDRIDGIIFVFPILFIIKFTIYKILI